MYFVFIINNIKEIKPQNVLFFRIWSRDFDFDIIIKFRKTTKFILGFAKSEIVCKYVNYAGV